MEQNFLHVGKRVIEDEINALQALKDSLGESFKAALQAIAGAQGRVVVTGMGKSGHVGGKIAATMASTGTPAFFIHPGEASHGDLGMIAPGDVVLALSNSGETKELTDVLFFAKRHGICLIALTQNPDSTLAELSDIVLLLPKVKEACPNGLAPTTSSTMMIAMGDALAVGLLESKGFSREDFKALHPGGQLGARLKRVQDIMHTGEAVPLVPENTLMKQALLVVAQKSLGCVGVVREDGTLSGIITDGDLRRHMSPNLLEKSVQDIMTRTPKSVGPKTLVEEALLKMSGTVTGLFVLDDQGVPLGFVHVHDLLRIGIV